MSALENRVFLTYILKIHFSAHFMQPMVGLKYGNVTIFMSFGSLFFSADLVFQVLR